MKDSTAVKDTPRVTVGIDLGDKHSQVFAMDTETGEVVEEGKLPTKVEAFDRRFRGSERSRIVIEAGTHSRWASALLLELGHEVLVANPRKVKLISQSDRKSDELDAELLARLGRSDPTLLSPIQHRGAEAQADLAVIRARDALVRVRTLLVNHVRGAVKSFGARVPAYSTLH